MKLREVIAVGKRTEKKIGWGENQGLDLLNLEACWITLWRCQVGSTKWEGALDSRKKSEDLKCPRSLREEGPRPSSKVLQLSAVYYKLRRGGKS